MSGAAAMTSTRPDADSVLSRDFSGWAEFTMAQPTSRGTTELTLHSGQIDEAARDYFGHAYCHWLAGAISSLTGWSIATLDRRDENGTWKPIHSVVISPQGTAVDIFGEYASIKEATDRYSECSNGAPVRYRIVPNEHMPGDVITGIDDWRGDAQWWNADVGDKHGAVFQHFARLVLTRAGHALTGTTSSTSSSVPAPRAVPQDNPTIPGGTSMNIDEIKAAIAGAQERISTATHQISGARTELGEATTMLAHATQGSSDAEVADALGALRRIDEDIEQLSRQALQAGESALSYSGRI